MKKFLFPALLSLLALTGTAQAKTISGRVVSIADGDTLTILVAGNKQERIRLAEIDAPESRQPFGQRSKQALVRMCGGKQAVAHVTDTDRYGRNIARVVCDGVDTTVEQVKLGMAWVYDGYVKDRSLYQLQDKARKSKTGLWADPHAVKPWEWRKGKRPSDTATKAQNKQQAAAGSVRGNRNSMVYHLPHCGSYNAINPKNIRNFKTEADARNAGYRKAGNCR